MKKTGWITLGVVAGMILGRILAPYIISFIARKTINSTTNHVSQNQVEQFTRDSSKISVSFTEYKYVEKRYKHFFTRHLTMSCYIFYDNKYKKYFALQIVSNDLPSISLLSIAKNVKVECMINNQQLKDIHYGTYDNPVFVLKLIIPPNGTWDEYDRADAKYIVDGNTDRLCKNNVYNYLTYFTPKEEFQKMFPDQK
jgi:hypothetical protein